MSRVLAEGAVLTHSFDGNVLVVGVGRDMDIVTSPRLWHAVQGVLDHADRVSLVVLDLTEVVLLDSLGITTLINLYQRARRRRLVLRIVVGERQAARRVLALAGVDTFLPLCSSVSAAIEDYPR